MTFYRSIPIVLTCLIAAPAVGQDFMSKQELQATIPGATLFGISNQDKKTRWVQTYSKGKRRGTIAGLWGKDEYASKWQIKGNSWCEEWDGGSGCWKLVLIDDKTIHPYRDGKTYTGAIWNIR